MNTEIIQSALLNFIHENLVGDNVLINAKYPLADAGLDSFSIIELVLYIERTFNVSLPDEALTRANVFTVQTLADCVMRYAQK